VGLEFCILKDSFDTWSKIAIIPLLLGGMPMVETPFTLSVSAAALSDTRVARLTRDLERDLIRGGIKARSLETSPALGEKGEPVTLGVLAVALISSGAVKALVECMKAYLSREPSLVIKLRNSNGIQAEINARNVASTDVLRALEATISPGSRSG
jgi:membrane-associated two-gene conflict system component 1 (EACC1)